MNLTMFSVCYQTSGVVFKVV